MRTKRGRLQYGIRQDNTWIMKSRVHSFSLTGAGHPVFETRQIKRGGAASPADEASPPGSLVDRHRTMVWNACEHIIVQYKDMNMQDARDSFNTYPPKNAHRRPDTFSQRVRCLSPIRRYRPRIYGYPCFVHDRHPGSMQLQKRSVSVVTGQGRR